MAHTTVVLLSLAANIRSPPHGNRPFYVVSDVGRLLGWWLTSFRCSSTWNATGLVELVLQVNSYLGTCTLCSEFSVRGHSFRLRLQNRANAREKPIESSCCTCWEWVKTWKLEIMISDLHLYDWLMCCFVVSRSLLASSLSSCASRKDSKM